MQPNHSRFAGIRPALIASALLLGTPILRAETLYGLGTGNFLFQFDSLTPGTVTTPVAVSGLGGSTLLGIDVRPADGLVYGIGTGDRVFSIQPATGNACIFDNFWIPPATYREVFEEAGFADFRFVDAHVAPGADPAPFRDFLEDCPICGISAVRPGPA